MHWARVDLTAPGIELYVTPTDQTLDGSDYQYRLKRVGTVAQREGLAVVVNGSLFAKESALIPGYRSGQRCQRSGNGGCRRARQPRLGTHVPALVRHRPRPDTRTPQAAAPGRARPREMGDWGAGCRTGRRARRGRRSIARRTPAPRSGSIPGAGSCSSRCSSPRHRVGRWKNSPSWVPATECSSTVAVRLRWSLGRARPGSVRARCWAGGARSRRTSASGRSPKCEAGSESRLQIGHEIVVSFPLQWVKRTRPQAAIAGLPERRSCPRLILELRVHHREVEVRSRRSAVGCGRFQIFLRRREVAGRRVGDRARVKEFGRSDRCRGIACSAV